MMPFFVELEGGHSKEPIWFECLEYGLVIGLFLGVIGGLTAGLPGGLASDLAAAIGSIVGLSRVPSSLVRTKGAVNSQERTEEDRS